MTSKQLPALSRLYMDHPGVIMPIITEALHHDGAIHLDVATYSLSSLSQLVAEHSDTEPKHLLALACKLSMTPTLRLAPSEDIEARVVMAMCEVASQLIPAGHIEQVFSAAQQAYADATVNRDKPKTTISTLLARHGEQDERAH